MRNLQDNGNAPPLRGQSQVRGIFRTFGTSWWRNRRAIVASFCFAVLAVGAKALLPWPLKFVIDNVLGSHPFPEPIFSWVTDLPVATVVLLLGGAFAFITGLRAFAYAQEKRLNARICQAMELTVRDRLISHMQRLSVISKTKQRSGDLVLRLIGDVRELVILFTNTAPLVARQATTLVVILIVMFAVEPRLGFLGLMVVVVMAWLIRLYAGDLHQATRRKRRREGETTGLAQEIVSSLPSAQALRQEDTIRNRFREVNRRGVKAALRQTLIAVSMERTIEICSGVALALVITGGGLLVLSGDLTVGELTVCATYIKQMLSPVKQLNELASRVARGIVRSKRLVSLLDRVPGVQDAPDASDIGRARGVVEFRDVSFAYPPAEAETPSTAVLSNVNMTLKPGTMTVLIGPSGSGKTTVVGLLLRLFDPTSGEILLDGVPVSRIRLERLRAQFAVMLQDTHLFAGTLREALRPTDREVTDDEIWEALEQVALGDFVRSLPGCLEAPLTENGGNLSGGQRARFSLARALLLDCPILILDEPLANVDVGSQQVILHALDRIRRGRTCFVVSHQAALTERADVVLQLENQVIKKRQPGSDLLVILDENARFANRIQCLESARPDQKHDSVATNDDAADTA